MMIPVLIVLLLLLAGFAIWKMNSSPTLHSPSRSRPPAPAAPRPRPRFSGRLVEADPSALRAPQHRARSRLRKNTRTTTINGRVVTPPDAIGLACLAPISECRLGDDCLCISRNGKRPAR